MLKKITNFIKYSNVFTIVAIVAFIAIASAVASNKDVRDKVLGEEIIETQGVDNTLLLATDLDNFDLEMKIVNVMEDTEPVEDAEDAEDVENIEDVEDAEPSENTESNQAGNYYIGYQYKTLGIQDNVWQEIFCQEQIVISKVALEGRDLGLYIMEELGEIIDYEIAYLKEVQENEEEKGETLIVETTIYTGLIGLVLDTKTKELPGYELVVKPPVVEETSSDDDAPHPNPLPTGERDDETADDYVEDSYYYEWLIGNCLSNGGYWYNSTCNAEPEAKPEPPLTPPDQGESPDDPEYTPVCDVDNLDLCIDQDLCEGAGLFWHGDVCNFEEEVIKDEEDEVVEEPTEKTDEEICLEMELFWYEGECHLEEEVIDEVPAPVVD